ncbi:pseudouridine synthase [Lactifluus subvellereus]|nr:pseudouridine synthase [Lactifluus subvellereus]
MSAATSAQIRRAGPGVLYVDRGVIVLNKPPGLVSQAAGPSHGISGTTGVDVPRHTFGRSLVDLRRRYGLSTNPYPVHRLDKGTTGALVLARTKALARELSQQFRTHAIEKTYLALVRGGARRFPAKEGLIAGSLGFRDGRVRIAAQTEQGSSKSARTGWELLASSDVAPLSLVRLYPHTGLKHQLRVHMAHTLKVPILGDTLYDNARSAQRILGSTDVPENRLFLHSSSISFWRYRRTGLRKRFRLTIVAPLPADFVKICRDLNLHVPGDVVQGGALVDGERLKGEDLPDVEGLWLGECSSV